MSEGQSFTLGDLSVPSPESQSPPSSDDLSSGPPTPPNLHQNTIDPSAKWLVQKFGGTSVGKFAVQIAEDIVACVYLTFHRVIISFPNKNLSHVFFLSRNYIDQHKVAIVCSARSGSTKALGTTNLLLRASAEALRRPTNANGKPSETPGTGTLTPVSRGLFGTISYSEGSQSPPTSPHSRSPSIPFSGLGFTPINSKDKKDAGPEFVRTVDLLRQEHITAARECVTRHPEILQEIEEEIQRDCDWLTSFLFALKVRSHPQCLRDE